MAIWKSINGFNNVYWVSDTGEIRSITREIIRKKQGKLVLKGKIRKPNIIKGGYTAVILFKQGKGKQYLVHRLVAETFIPNPKKFQEVNHLNEIKTDNRVENLEWCDRKYNCNFGTRNQRISKKVIQFDKNGNYIKEWASAPTIKKYLGLPYCGKINECCKGKRKTAYGFIWKYKESA